MGALIYDSTLQAWKDAEIALRAAGGVKQDGCGMIWDSFAQAWKEVKIGIPQGVTWANSSESEIAELLTALDENNMTLYDYGWRVGDERNVYLAGNINEDVVFVIEDLNNVTSGGTSYHAAVGQKDGLRTTRKMNSSNTNSGGYNSSAMKSFIEGDYQTALQNATTGNFWSSVKSATHKSQIYSSGLQSTTAKVILHSIFETNSNNTHYGGNNWAQYMPDETTANGFHQFEWYKTSANRIKHQGIGGSANTSWSRSAFTTDGHGVWGVYTDGTSTYSYTSGSLLVAPLCCI